MTLKQAMTALRKMGTAQNRKVYARHGAGENLFGVSFANIGPLAQRIGTDQALAEQLGETGNSDARTLATMIADPEQFTASSADAWVGSIAYSLRADLFAPVIARSPLANRKLSKSLSGNSSFQKSLNCREFAFLFPQRSANRCLTRNHHVRLTRRI